jgi:hypothetical protein
MIGAVVAAVAAVWLAFLAVGHAVLTAAVSSLDADADAGHPATLPGPEL